VLPTFNIFLASAGLLAFILAFYALIAREKRTPYITASVYSTTNFVLFIIAIAAVAEFVEKYLKDPDAASFIASLAHVLFVVAIANVFYRIWIIHNRHIHFKDDNLVKNLGWFRRYKEWRRVHSNKPIYEHAPLNIPEQLAKDLEDISPLTGSKLAEIITSNAKNSFSSSLAFRVNSHNDCNSILKSLIHIFWKHNFSVQYMACSRHPAEFIAEVDKKLEQEKLCNQNKDNFVVIDAHTSNYGFTDSIYPVWDRTLKRNHGLEVVNSNGSYAGMHSAAAKAFNALKHKSADKENRKPTLVIYECPFAVSDVESIEQYRIFMRHVLPSERLWGGMLTVVVEASIDDSNWHIISSYADVSIDLTQPQNPHD